MFAYCGICALLGKVIQTYHKTTNQSTISTDDGIEEKNQLPSIQSFHSKIRMEKKYFINFFSVGQEATGHISSPPSTM